METGSPIEDQFSKVHPCFHTNTRIGIIGAGPSGLSAAYALCKLGYSNVTVLEKHWSVGGMCESVEIEGGIYDLGGQVLAANSAPTIFHLAKEIGAETEELDDHKFAIIDTTGKYNDTKVIDDYISIISLTLKLQDEANATGRIGVHAISDIASEPTPSFLRSNGLESVPKSVAYGFTASGYGFVQDMPYAYVHEFTRTSMAGKIRRFKNGYTSVWDKISKQLPAQIHSNTQVLTVSRNGGTIKIEAKILDGETQYMEFDKLIVSGSFPLQCGKTYRSPSKTTVVVEETVNGVMDLSDFEKELFSKVDIIDYYTTVLKIDGLDHIPIGFYYFQEFMDDPKTIGNPVAMQRFYPDTNIFLFWSYGNSTTVVGSKVIQLAIDVATSIGGKVKKVILQRRFKYFPHVNSQEMKDGFYEKLEHQLQGQNNTFYVGGLMAFELTERNSSYAFSLVMKHFASHNPQPKFPYIKRLLTLRSNNHSSITKQLEEEPGVKFPDITSIDGYLRHWGNHERISKKTLYIWTNDKGEAINRRTYKELNDNASYIAHKLLTNNKPIIKPGDRVLLVYIPGMEFIDAFFGCLRARVIPVPAIPPDPSQTGGQSLLHIENISKKTKAVAILSTFGYHVFVKANHAKNKIMLTRKTKDSPSWPNIPWLHTDSWIKNFKGGDGIISDDIVKDSKVLPQDLCFLQFTSGSTGDAKGVMITHGGLVHNVKLMRKVYKSTSNTILVSWLPQYHDMGLIGGFLTSLVSGGTGVLFSPITFIKNPLLWLHTMSKFRATHSAGPNFAFELLIRRLVSKKENTMKLDLSSMVFLMVAAEPVRSKTLKRFIELTQGFGLSQEVMAPGYGMAENSVYVCCAYGNGEPIYQDFQGRICCGYVDPNNDDVDIRIVDPETSEEHKECGKEGEIWVSSLSAGVGYWAMEELSQKTFSNQLEGNLGKMYIRSGDLGWIIDGKLFITGRIKDMIIVSGRNIYSSDVEKTVESSCEFIRPGCCAVVGVPEEILSSKGVMVPENSDMGLVVISEVRGNLVPDEDIMERIQSHVVEDHGITIASIVFIKEKSICKTTSGKIRRFECLKQFTGGKLQVIKAYTQKQSLVQCTTPKVIKDESFVLSKKEIVDFFKKLLSDQTGIQIGNISVTESLVSYGIDSIGVVRASQKLSSFLGVPVGAIDIFTATCIDDLAEFAEDLIRKNCAKSSILESHFLENKTHSIKPTIKPSLIYKFGIWGSHLFGLVYLLFLLTIPIYTSVSLFATLIYKPPCFSYLISLTLAPLVWMIYILSSCLTITIFGNSFLQPNYGLSPDTSIWSINFVKWWSLYKVQDIASKNLAVHLKGTIFVKLWFEMLGAKIGSAVVLDTIDITDPYLVTIGDGAVIAEGALIQSHAVKNGVLSLQLIKIGENSCVGPYSVIQKGSIIADGAEVPALQSMKGGQHEFKISKIPKLEKGTILQEVKHEHFYHILGIYMVGFLSSLSAAICYMVYIWLFQMPQSFQHFSFVCLCASVHWLPFNVLAYAIIFKDIPTNQLSFAFTISMAYLSHGIILTFLTSIFTHFLSKQKHKNHLVMWFCHRLTTSCHLKFAKFLSGTEAFCVYLRLLGAKIGHHCSIRAINSISVPDFVSIGDGVHLGDFSRIVPGVYTSKGYIKGHLKIQENSVIGSQGVVLPGAFVEPNVILGALSIAPMNSILKTGGVFVGSQTPVMVKNMMHILDDRIEEMDKKYKKVLGNLAANFATATLKVKSRYFHRIGACGKGTLKLYDNIPGFPDHKIFSPGMSYSVVLRHSNCLSSDDDARLDPRGAAIRILSNVENSPLLDLTLKTGKAFHARTIGDFATWLVCGAQAREEHVKHAPHVRDAMWDSLRKAISYADLHYYSNICRLFRFKDGNEMYVKFKLRPFDKKINEDSGKVDPIGVLPPETGAIPRDENDTRPLLFLDDDFVSRVKSLEKIRYVLQFQFREVPKEENGHEVVLDCTKPWDEKEYPYVEIGKMVIDELLSKEESERLEFNPFLRCDEVDVIRATSCSQSASMDHGRSVVYSICQHIRNNKPLPEAWRSFLEHSDVKVDLTGCPMGNMMVKKNVEELTLTRPWYKNLWMLTGQPILQIGLPYFLMGLIIFTPLQITCFLKGENSQQLHWVLLFCWLVIGVLSGLVCGVAKWVLVGKKKEGESVIIWSVGVYMDTIWQAIKTLFGDYFIDMTSGSVFFGIWMNLMGSDVAWDEGAYVDGMGAVLNPEMVSTEKYGSVGREALLFGHIYEGEGGKVKFGKISVKEGGFVGSRGVVMPGVIVENEGSLAALSVAMKGEIVK